MSIEIHDTSAESLFNNGEIVFKIIAAPLIDQGETTTERHVNMVTRNEDYIARIRSHVYTPLLYTSSFYVRLAYLYDCLNRTFGVKRDERFTFWYRKVNYVEWYRWFSVHPIDDV